MINMPIRFNISYRGLGSGESRIYLPMDMFKPHEEQAQKNHQQTLEKLAKRGGLAPAEAIDILKDQKFNKDHPHQTDLTLCLHALIANYSIWSKK